ncbi:hypothetical protein Tco_0377149 [Tanacetum coccineum]
MGETHHDSGSHLSKYVRSGCTTALNVVPWETDGESVLREANGTESKEQDSSSRSGNDAHTDDADIRPIYNEEPMAKIPKGHRFSINKTTTVHEKTTSPRSCLRWQPTGRILKTVCLRWVPTGKTFASSTTKVESEPPNGSNADITNQCESKQALNVSAGTLLSTGTSFYPTEEGLRVWLRKRKISQKTGLQGILI